MQKRVLEVLKTWYFPYSAYWSAGQWGEAIAPPRPPLATLLIAQYTQSFSLHSTVISRILPSEGLKLNQSFLPNNLWNTYQRQQIAPKQFLSEKKTLIVIKSIESRYIVILETSRVPQKLVVRRRVARNSQWGGLFGGSGGEAPSRRRPMGVWGRSPQLSEAGGLGAKPPAAGGPGVWGRSPQRSKILHFFAKITSF